jgi:hypothetical protein
MGFLLSDLGLKDGTLAPVIPVIKLLAGTAMKRSFSIYFYLHSSADQDHENHICK